MPRSYVVVRTDRHRKDYILSELEAGRLRHGWGWDESQNLASIAGKVSARGQLTQLELAGSGDRRRRHSSGQQGVSGGGAPSQ